MTGTLAQTPLHDWHAAHGGRMVDFAGWSMPVQYTSIVAEHEATRNDASVFDISHMGRLRFDGPGVAAFLDGLVTRRVTDQPPGRVRYSLVTNDSAGVLDDVLVYHLQDAGGGSYYLVVVNASNREKIVDWIRPRLPDESQVMFADLTHDWAMLAVQGPNARAKLQPLVATDLAAMKYYTALETRIAGHGGLVSRTGYTGEDGYEVIVGPAAVQGVWESLVGAGVVAAGLGARDTLRLEAGMPLYGHELSEQIDPIEADLAFAVDLEGRTFPGSAELGHRGPSRPRRRVGLELTGRRVPREGYDVVVDGRTIGRVTSGTFSPSLARPLAMAYVASEFAAPGTSLAVDVRGQSAPATVVELPFYRKQSKGN